MQPCSTVRGKSARKEIRRQDESLERAAITLTEGGGGALYGVCSKLKKTGIEGKVARVFKEILRDEMEHKDNGARALAAVVKTETAFRRAAGIIREVSSQRLRMRNEQFDFPMSEKELRALDETRRTVGKRRMKRMPHLMKDTLTTKIPAWQGRTEDSEYLPQSMS